MKNTINGTLIISIFVSAFPIISFPSANRIMIDYYGNTYLTSYNNDREWNRITKISSYDKVKKVIAWDYTIIDATNCALDSLALDPAGKMLVYISACQINAVIPSDIVAKSFYRLTVLNLINKKEVVSFDHGFYFSFSPSGDAIVIANRFPGEDELAAPPGYQQGMWIYNFSTKTKKKLTPAYVGATDINWSGHDGHIYVDNNGQVYRYDPTTGKGQKVDYRGIYFTPDGKYNIYIYDRFYIFRTADGQEMLEMEKQIKGYQFVGFADKMKSAIFWDGKGENIIFDLNQGKVVGKFSGGFMGTNPEGTKFAVRPLGPDQKLQTDKVEIINLLDLIQK